MTFTLPFEEMNSHVLNKFSQIDLLLSEGFDQNKVIELSKDILNNKNKLSITLYSVEPFIELLYNLSSDVYLNVILNEKNKSEIIYYSKILRKFRSLIKIKGEWNKNTIKNIKMFSNLRFNIFVYFKTIETINQKDYEDLFNFIFLNPLLFISVEPFKSIMLHFLNKNNNIDLYKIYNEVPGFSYYKLQKSISLGLLWEEKNKEIGFFNKDLSNFEETDFYRNVLNAYQMNIKKEFECNNCEFRKLCRGYIKNLYDICNIEWKEIFSTIKDLSSSFKMNLK